MAMDRVSGLEALSKVLEEGNSDFLRRVLLMGLQAVMESDVAGLCQSGPGERTPSRENHRASSHSAQVATIAASSTRRSETCSSVPGVGWP